MKNQIYSNFKSNIAFGGNLAGNTVISNNKIYNGRCEGIFMIKSSGHPWIQNNEIYGNHDGVIVVDSNPLIFRN